MDVAEERYLYGPPPTPFSPYNHDILYIRLSRIPLRAPFRAIHYRRALFRRAPFPPVRLSHASPFTRRIIPRTRPRPWCPRHCPSLPVPLVLTRGAGTCPCSWYLPVPLVLARGAGTTASLPARDIIRHFFRRPPRVFEIHLDSVPFANAVPDVVAAVRRNEIPPVNA